MKRYRVVIDTQARQSLRHISDYIRRTDSDAKAKYVRQELLKAARRLVTLPHRHSVLLTSQRTGIIYRYIPKWQFKIIFTVEEENDRVIVIRLFHDKENPEKLEEILP